MLWPPSVGWQEGASGEERQVTERERDRWGHRETLVCSVCGASNHSGDRFCGECGALLASNPGDGGSISVPSSPHTANVAAPQGSKKPDQENVVWVLGAHPRAVVGGGLLLLLLAVVLLVVGQRDNTDTIVMLSICTAPLGLMVLVIGIARYIAGVARGGETRVMGDGG